MVGDLRQRRVGMGAQLADHQGKRVGEVLVITDTKAIAGHIDAGAEARVIGMETDQPRALLRGQDGRRLSVAELAKRLGDLRPGEGGEALLDGHASQAGDAPTAVGESTWETPLFRRRPQNAIARPAERMWTPTQSL